MQCFEGLRRRRLGLAVLTLFAVGLLSACSIRQADVQTNTISASNPTAFHTVSDTGNTSIGLAARDGRCAGTFAGHAVRACRFFFKAAFAGNTSSIQAIVPNGAQNNAALAYGDIPPNVGPVATVEASDKISLQPQVKYQTQACAWVDYSDDSAGFQGPFCVGRDTNGDGSADVNTFGPVWITQTDPSGFNVSRRNGVIQHWSDTSTERHVDVGNCVNATLLANNPGLATGFNELNQWNVANRLLVRNVACNAANREIRAFNQNQGNNGLYGQASFSFYTASGHIVFNDACCSNPTFFVNDAAVNAFPDNFDELVVKHEMGHAFGVAHDERTLNLMAPVNAGTPTEVDQANRDTINFLYGHTDATNGNSGDSATPGARDAAAVTAHDPVTRQLRRQGTGARVTTREGAYETVTYTNRGDTVAVQHTVYTPNQEGRQAASAQAAAAPLTP